MPPSPSAQIAADGWPHFGASTVCRRATIAFRKKPLRVSTRCVHSERRSNDRTAADDVNALLDPGELRNVGVVERLSFRCKATVLQTQRALRNVASVGRLRHERTGRPDAYTLIAESITPLWSMLDGESPRLTAGKVQNLRRAVREIDGVVIPADTVFSFWCQLGRASSRRGYVEGRELRSGCLVPTVGGGLCQLSCALYQVAVQSGMQITERHSHSQRLPGVAGFSDYDATVFWNYVDLRWRSPFATRLQARLDSEQLIVRLYGESPRRKPAIHATIIESPAANNGTSDRPERMADVPARDCESCDETGCTRHRPRTEVAGESCVLLDERWPEFLEWIRMQPEATRRLASWQSAPAPGALRTCGRGAALLSSIDMRLAKLRSEPAARGRMRRDCRIAAAMACCIGVGDRHLVVAQTLLPWLWMSGVLGGREFEVLMTRAPMSEIQLRLEKARERWPDSPTLGDFRAPAALIEGEAEALAHAKRRIGAHPLWLNDGDQALAWRLAPAARSQRSDRSTRRVLFPLTTLARNGACLVREALLGSSMPLDLGGPVLESPDFWRGIDVQAMPASGWHQATVAVYPTILPARPQAALDLIAAGVPVIATPEAGLPGMPGVHVVSGQDPVAWRGAIADALNLGG